MKIPKVIQDLFAFTIQKPDERELSIAGKAYRLSSQPQLTYNEDDLVSRKGLAVYDRMRHDDQVKNSLFMKKEACLSLDWKIEPADDTPAAKEQADFISYVLDQIPGTFNNKLREILTGVEYGFSVTEKIYKLEDFGTYKGKVIFADLKTRAPHPFYFETDPGGNLTPNGLLQNQARLPVDKFIIYTHNKEFDNWYGNSDLRAAYRSWWSKDVIIKFWNVYLERYGQPPIMAKPKSNLSPEQRTLVLDIINDFQTKSGIVLPSWLEMELLEATRGTAQYETAIEKHNLMISRSILVPDLVGQTSTSGQGSYALGSKHFDVFLWILKRMADDIEETIVNDQIIKPLIIMNYGKQEKYPSYCYETLDEEGSTARSKVIELGVTSGFIDPNEDWIREYLYLPEKAKGLKLNPQPKAVPPVPGKPGNQMPVPKDMPSQNGKYDKVEIIINSNGKFVNRFRVKTDPEKKVQFKRIESDLNAIENKMFKDAAEVVQRQIEDLTSKISSRRIIENKDSNAVGKLEIKYRGDLRRVFQEGLLDELEAGQKDVKGELKEVGIKFAAEPDLRSLTTPNQAADYLKSKAFVWAGTTSDFLLSKVQNSLYNGIKNGKSTQDVIAEIQQDLEPLLGTGVIDDAAISSQRLETAIRTNLTEAYNEGRKLVIQDPEIANDVPVIMYSAIIDGRQTEFCDKHDGLQFYANDPIWDKITPPNHYQCRSILVPVTTAELDPSFKPDKEPNIDPAPGFFRR